MAKYNTFNFDHLITLFLFLEGYLSSHPLTLDPFGLVCILRDSESCTIQKIILVVHIYFHLIWSYLSSIWSISLYKSDRCSWNTVYQCFLKIFMHHYAFWKIIFVETSIVITCYFIIIVGHYYQKNMINMVSV